MLGHQIGDSPIIGVYLRNPEVSNGPVHINNGQSRSPQSPCHRLISYPGNNPLRS
ncbi:MAG: hypothetical protein QNL33_11225 [Akkermansiaceae bacterium]